MPQKKRTTPNKQTEEKPVENEAATDKPVEAEQPQSVYDADEIQAYG